MPLVRDEGDILLPGRAALPGGMPRVPDWSELWGPAFRMDNTAGSVAAEEAGLPPAPAARLMQGIDERFDPFGDVAGYENDAGRFALANSDAEVLALKRQIDRERQDRAIVEAAGWKGFVASLVAGVADPINLVPVGGQIVRGMRTGQAIGRAAVSTARAAVIGAGVAEGVLQATQQTRTAAESVEAIGGAAILGGVLGGSAEGIRRWVELRRVARGYDGARADPFGPDRGVAAISVEQWEPEIGKVLIDKGQLVQGADGAPRLKASGAVDLATNHGLVKVIWRHGEESPKDVFVRREDVLALPRIMREWAQSESSPDGGPTWVVNRAAEGQKPEWVVYGLRKWTAADGAHHVVTIHMLDAEVSDLKPSLPRRGEGSGAPSEPSRQSRFRNPTDTVEGATLSPTSQGAESGAPQPNIVRDGANANARRVLTPDELDTAAIEADLRGGNEEAALAEIRAALDAAPGRVADDIAPEPGGAASFDEAADFDLPEPDTPAPGPGISGSAGAAARLDPELERLQSAFGLEKALAFQDPLMRTATSPSLVVRNVAQQLTESPLAWEKNRQGIPTPVAVETRVKMRQAGLYDATAAMDELWVRYRLQRAARPGDATLLQARDLATGQAFKREAGAGQPLTHSQFRVEIGRAMRRGDAHTIPEVAEAAKIWRSRVFEPLKKAGQEAGLLDADLDAPLGADSYLTRLYNHDRMTADRPDFIKRVAGWLDSEQTKKREIQTKMQDVLEELDYHEARVASLEDRIAGREETIGKNEAAQDVAQRFNRFAYNRSAEMSEELDGLRAQIRDLEAAGQPVPKDLRNQLQALEKRRVPRAQGGAVFESRIRAEVNAQADRLSGRMAARDALQADLEARQARLEELRGQMEELVQSWEGKSSREAKGALSARAEAEAGRDPDQPRLRGADKAVDRAARAIADAVTDLEFQELEDLAGQIAERIMGTPDGRLPYDMDIGSMGRGGFSPDTQRLQAAGPMQGRRFAIPDALIEPYLESDIELVGRAYVRSMAPDVELQRQFGSIGLDDQLGRIQADYRRLMDAAPDEAARRRLERRRQNDIRDLAAMRDRLRGIYALPRDVNGFFPRTGRVLRTFNYMRLLGGMTVAAFTDLGKVVAEFGLGRVFGVGLRALATNFQGYRLAGEEVKRAGTALDMVLDSRAMAIADVMDDYGRGSRFERGLGSAATGFSRVALMAPWNAALKQFTGLLTIDRVLEAAEAVARGTASADQLARLAQSGIDEGRALSIAREFASHGATERGLRQPRTAGWTDRRAVDALRAAVVKEVDSVVVTPGIGDRPLWMSTELGKFVGQFKSFAFASVQRTLLTGLQRRDMNMLMGWSMMVGLGMGVYALKQWQADRPVSDDWRVWLSEGFDRSGTMGWFFEANNMIEKVTRGRVGVNALLGGPPMSRYASRDMIGALIGPSAGLIEDATTATGAAFAGDFTGRDTERLRRLLPYQNLFYLRRLFNEAEYGINDSLGIPQKPQR